MACCNKTVEILNMVRQSLPKRRCDLCGIELSDLSTHPVCFKCFLNSVNPTNQTNAHLPKKEPTYIETEEIRMVDL